MPCRWFPRRLLRVFSEQLRMCLACRRAGSCRWRREFVLRWLPVSGFLWASKIEYSRGNTLLLEGLRLRSTEGLRFRLLLRGVLWKCVLSGLREYGPRQGGRVRGKEFSRGAGRPG